MADEDRHRQHATHMAPLRMIVEATSLLRTIDMPVIGTAVAPCLLLGALLTTGGLPLLLNTLQLEVVLITGGGHPLQARWETHSE